MSTCLDRCTYYVEILHGSLPSDTGCHFCVFSWQSLERQGGHERHVMPDPNKVPEDPEALSDWSWFVMVGAFCLTLHSIWRVSDQTSDLLRVGRRMLTIAWIWCDPTAWKASEIQPICWSFHSVPICSFATYWLYWLSGDSHLRSCGLHLCFCGP